MLAVARELRPGIEWKDGTAEVQVVFSSPAHIVAGGV